MAKLQQIVSFLTSALEPDLYQDHSLNGVQVAGSADVNKLAVAVDACVETIEKSVATGVQMLLVHHGLFWGKPVPIQGPLRNAVKLLIENDISLYAAHLPLDAHSEYGNNFTLARLLGMSELEPSAEYYGRMIGCIGQNKAQLSLDGIRERLATLPGASKDMLMLKFGPEIPKRISIVSGSGADQLYHSEIESFDTLIAGEAKQFAYHYAKERGLNVIFAGHYATETVGVQELGKALQKSLGVPWTFIDVPTGI